MAEEEEPKHPYVTETNAKVHLVFSIIVMILSVIQLILGIILLEREVSQMNRWRDGILKYGHRHNFDDFDEYFFGDHIWIAILGVILSILGFSVYRSRSRANGIMLSVMCLISGFIAYPIAEGLGIGYNQLDDAVNSISAMRIGSGIFTVVINIVVLSWGFYASGHACCNSNVRTQTRVTIQPQHQQVYTIMPSNQQVVYPQSAVQPAVVQQVPPPYIPPAVIPAQIYHGGDPAPPQRQDSHPPAYAE